MINVQLTMHQLGVLLRELSADEVKAFSDANVHQPKPRNWNDGLTATEIYNRVNFKTPSDNTIAGRFARYFEALNDVGEVSPYHNSLDAMTAERDGLNKACAKFREELKERDKTIERLTAERNTARSQLEETRKLNSIALSQRDDARRLHANALGQLAHAQQECDETRKELAELTEKYTSLKSRAPVPVTSYVQPVPDHCDRIVWRDRTYHLAGFDERNVEKLSQLRIQLDAKDDENKKLHNLLQGISYVMNKPCIRFDVIVEKIRELLQQIV